MTATSMACSSVSETEQRTSSLLHDFRACAAGVIDHGTRPVAVLHAAEPRHSLSACIAIARVHEEGTRIASVLDADCKRP